MNIESRLRDHLSSLDGLTVTDAERLVVGVERAERRRRRRRRVGASVAAVALTIAGGVVLWSTRSTSTAGSADRGEDQANVSSTAEPATTQTSSTSTSTAQLPVDPATTISTTTVTPTTPSNLWGTIAPDPRGRTYYPTAVWTGTEAIVVGGTDPDGHVRSGAEAYDPVSDRWRALAGPPGSKRIDPLSAWTGSEMLVVGGDNPDHSLLVSYGLAYNPTTDTWRTMASPTVGFMSNLSPAAWDGKELLVWPSDGGGPSMRITPIAYEPTTDSWRELPEPPVARRQEAASVWTGTEWLVWGGENDTSILSDGVAYNPTTDTWRVLAASPVAGRRTPGVWTGTEMIVDAGSSGGDPAWTTEPDGRQLRHGHNGEFAFGDGAAYNPATDTWRRIADGPAHPGFVPVWTGSHMLMFAKGGVSIYEVGSDTWPTTSDDAYRDPTGGVSTPLWAGGEVILLGSDNLDIGGSTFNSGALTAPVVDRAGSTP